MTIRSTLSRAQEVFLGNMRFPGHASGRIGAPLDNAVVRFICGPWVAPATGDIAAAALHTTAGITPLITDLLIPTQYADVFLGRCVSFTSAGDDSLVTVTIVGLDSLGRPQTEIVTLADTGTAISQKAFGTLISLTPSATTTSCSVQTTDADVGLPYKATQLHQVSTFRANDGTAIAQVVTVAETAAQSATNADPRGTVSVADGSLLDNQYMSFDMMIRRGSTDDGLGVPPYTT